jgi:ferrous iron transport protein A
MTKDALNPPSFSLSDIASQCERRRKCGPRSTPSGTPLSETCCNGRVRVCAINGDRRTCAKIANLGVLPGSEIELLCKGGGQQCMIKINDSTISLDAPTAANILVAPA